MCGNQCVDNARYCEKCGHPFSIVQSTQEPQQTSVNLAVQNLDTAPIIAQSTVADLPPSTETLWQYKHKVPPTQWLKFWTYFRLPFGLLIAIGYLYDFDGLDAGEMAVTLAWFMIIFAATIATIVGLHLRKLWGWKLNWVLLVSECFFYPFSMAENTSGTELLWLLIVGWIILGLGWGLPNFIYFKKRRVLFE